MFAPEWLLSRVYDSDEAMAALNAPIRELDSIGALRSTVSVAANKALQLKLREYVLPCKGMPASEKGCWDGLDLVAYSRCFGLLGSTQGLNALALQDVVDHVFGLGVLAASADEGAASAASEQMGNKPSPRLVLVCARRGPAR